MEAIFMKLVNLSLTASWLVLMVLLVRLIFRKAPKWSIVLLWGLVALRLACPFSIESVFSLIPSGEPLPQSMISGAKPMVDAEIPPSTPEMTPVLSETMTPAVGAAETAAPPWLTALTWIWLIGLIAMLSYAFLSYFLLKRRMATATRLRDHIKQSEHVESPFVLGLFRPTIYLPYTIEAVDMVHVIAHEQAHIKRWDHWWKPLGFLLLSVYWFNPVLWVAFILLCRDIESACDEKVIRDMDKVDRQAYSIALLNCAVHRRRIAAYPLAFGEVSVKERIRNVMSYKKPTFWIVFLSLLMCAVLSVCFLTNPVKPTFDFDAHPIDHVITQYSPTAEAADRQHVKRLDQEQTEELQARLLGMTGAKRTERHHHAGTIASIDIVLSNGHDIYIQSLEDGNLQLQYDSKIFRVEDKAFHQYVKDLCSSVKYPYGTEPITDPRFAFSDLAHLKFQYFSGNGDGVTCFRIDPDATFTGTYRDWDTDPSGNHPNGITRYSEFYGGLGAVEMINDYTVRVAIKGIVYPLGIDTEEIRDGMLYQYTEAVGFEVDPIRVLLHIYLPNAPVEELPEAFRSSTGLMQDIAEDSVLGVYGVFEVEGQNGSLGCYTVSDSLVE